ncbi:hypothetical protein PFNF54_01627 [Plasmodium falciparum NF54]|uniref:Rifin n=1 Tax=Plasmodium falciparum (isolate NF54) TaxID=5843 RepID=W7JY31_PLAFO|nr:hypothetical protein PFNF54_01627 [Plasmodium falciparum NF54]
MKLYYTKILLFCLPLNILAHSKNKLYMKPHTRTTTSRVLSECDIEKSIYDNNPDMKYVKENFDRQTSQRFEEYKERMIKNRQKCKEQCEKDIKQIILKDKIDKSVEEKIEKVCLRCGCGLGGVAASVGLFGGIGTYCWKISATAAAIEAAKQAGIQAGIDAAIAQIKTTKVFTSIWNVEWTKFINESNYNSIPDLVKVVKDAMTSIEKTCTSTNVDRVCNGILTDSNYFISPVAEAGNKAATVATESAKTTKLGEVAAASYSSYIAIAYSVIALLIILLVMVIIYLILRYRRKKKMKKKAQYTKLLNE